jgi:hypothetical protein
MTLFITIKFSIDYCLKFFKNGWWVGERLKMEHVEVQKGSLVHLIQFCSRKMNEISDKVH